MKFVCDSCNTKYSIADERVRGRVLKIRCKKCDFVITVREDSAAAAAAVALPTDDDFAAALGSLGGENEATKVGNLDSVGLGAGAPAAPSAPEAAVDDWYVSFDGEQEGPFSLERAVERVKAEAKTDKEAHAWRPGYLVWLPVEEVPELLIALSPKKPALPPRIPVGAMASTPIGQMGGQIGGAPRGAVANQIAKDPSGPRAALSVGASTRPAPSLANAAPLAAAGAGEARLDLRKASAPPIPAAAMNGGAKPLRGPGSSGTATPAMPGLPAASASTSSAAPSSVLAASPSGASPASSSSPPPKPLGLDLFADPPAGGPMFPESKPSDEEEGSPDLNISNEASGLVNMAHLRAAAFGRATGPAFINGHTGRQTGSNRAISNSSLDAMPGNPRQTGPVVVVAGNAPAAGAHPLFKWIAILAVPGCIGLGAGMWYYMTHVRVDTIIVTEPSRHVEDVPITVTDPTTGKQTIVYQKKTSAKHTAPKPVAVAAAPGQPAAPQAPSNPMNDIYGESMQEHGPGSGPSRGGGQQGGQVSQSSIMNAVNANRKSLNLCFDRALKHDNTIKSGRVPIQVTVGISGRVTAVSISDQKYASTELGQCFVMAVKKWSFPASDASYTTEFPFILQAQ